MPIVVVLVGIVAYFYSDIITNFSNDALKIIDEFSSITPTPETKTEPKATPTPKPESTPKTAPETKPKFTPAPTPDKPVINIQELELQIHNLLNNERQSSGLQPLSFDTKLVSIAREHSEDMVLRNFFDHINPEGQDPTARGLQDGYTCHKELGGGYYTEGIAENIYQNNLYDSWTQYGFTKTYDWNTQEEIAKSTVDGWMHSSGHRQNILTSIYDRQGIGVAIASDDKVYITEDFC